MIFSRKSFIQSSIAALMVGFFDLKKFVPEFDDEVKFIEEYSAIDDDDYNYYKYVMTDGTIFFQGVEKEIFLRPFTIHPPFSPKS